MGANDAAIVHLFWREPNQEYNRDLPVRQNLRSKMVTECYIQQTNVPEGVEGFGSSLSGGRVLFLCPRDPGCRSTVTDSAGRVHRGFGRAPSSRRSFCGVTLCGPGLEPDDPMLHLLVLKSRICFWFKAYPTSVGFWPSRETSGCLLQNNYPFIAESLTPLFLLLPPKYLWVQAPNSIMHLQHLWLVWK